MKTVFKTEIAGYPLCLHTMARNRYAVTYGEQFHVGLDYAQAAKELGECLLHGLTCEGKLDNQKD